MICHDAIQLLVKFRDEDSADNIAQHLSANLDAACALLEINSSEISEFPTIKTLSGELLSGIDKDNVIWKYICLAFHILIDHVEVPANENDLENLLSVSQQKDIKTLLEIVLVFGLVPNLIPGVGVSLNARSQYANKIPRENLSLVDKYVRLRFCTDGLLKCSNNSDLRKFIINRHLGDLLAALFQLCFAPFKKPSASTSNEFQVDTKLYQVLQTERIYFKKALRILLDTTYQPLLFNEIMLLMGLNKPLAPKWLKAEASRILCDMLMMEDGVLHLTRAMFDSETVDTGVEWRQMEVVQKLIFDIGSTSSYPNFYKLLCSQILVMLSKVEDTTNTRNLFLILPRLFIKSMVERRKDIFEKNIFLSVIEPLQKCSIDSKITETDCIVEKDLIQALRFLYLIFGLEINSKTDINIHEYLLPYIDIFYQIYAKLKISEITTYTQYLLLKIFNNLNSKHLSEAVDMILFRTSTNSIHTFNNHLEILPNPENGVVIKYSNFKINYIISVEDHAFKSLIENLSDSVQANIFKIIFNEYCNIFSSKSVESIRSDLLRLELNFDEFATKLATEKLTALNILATLAEKKSVMQKLDMSVLIKFVLKLIKKYQNNADENFENNDGIFLAVMLLEVLLNNSIETEQLKCAINPLQAIASTTNNAELKNLIDNICMKLRNGSGVTDVSEKSPFEKALDEIRDPLLPVRAHGLMTLTKLIENKDSEACARKQYILFVFQENLKNADSYIYLTAINGIAALATAYTDSVIEILTEEYVNVKEWRDENEHQRVRMNLGEILLKVTKNLGEMAPKYKSLLLNAFLFGTKDYDNLIRASSLSNLGQVCEVLGYKLGNATTEVLQCLNAIIETDKSVEARRAAVMVIYQLLKGLGNETIVFLKEALLPIYRKLKDIYMNEKDDAMRLHAQLALEELNTATRNFLMPPVNSVEKKFKIIDS